MRRWLSSLGLLALAVSFQSVAHTQTNLGTEFWATDMNHFLAGNFSIAVANPSTTASATVTVSKVSGTVATTVVPPGGLFNFLLGTNHISGTGTSTNPTFRVTSDIPVAAYQFNAFENVFTNDASLLLPKSVLSTSYFVAGWGQSFNSASPQMGIVATETGTTSYTVLDSTGGTFEVGTLTQFQTRQL